MNLYPAIDLFEGSVVRLARGDFAKKTVYSGDPVQVAREWVSQGAAWLHIVDLEGAQTGRGQNRKFLKEIRAAVRCRIQFGGGLRSFEELEETARMGIDRVILGTRGIESAFVSEAVARFGSKIAVGLDVRQGRVQIEGWLRESDQALEAAIRRLNDFAVETIVYTDIQKDGTLEGPDWKGLRQVLAMTRAKIILSGGVATLDDVRKCAETRDSHLEGVIVGRALYEKKFSVREALDAIGAGARKGPS